MPRSTHHPHSRRPLPSPFVQLLDAVHEIDGLERIRFTSPHPKGYGDDLVAAYARLPKLCESAHLPLQSGSDRILKLMHRGYTRAQFRGIVQKLRRARPGIGITTDIIVGFPGETEEDFEQTLSLCREVEFDNAYIFKYSPRRDTPGRRPCPTKCRRPSARSATIACWNWSMELPRANTTPSSAGRCRFWWRGPSRKNGARYTGRTRCNKNRALRRRRTPSRPAHGCQNRTHRLVYVVWRSGGGEFVNAPAATLN